MPAPLISDTPPPCPRPPLDVSHAAFCQSKGSHAPRLPASTTRTSKSRRHSLPLLTFPPVAQPNTSSISLIPSTAEGRPVPLDDSSTAGRTIALRQLNRSQPSSRHRYSKSGGAPSATTTTTTGTHSQPVIVRTYSGPPPSSAGSRPSSRRIPLSTVSVASSVSSWRPGRNGMVLSMARNKGQKKVHQRADDPKLPPLEAFSFKSIMADIQQDIGADLDRIAEICARSKYSLSNQYEVHVAPHGSGASFVTSVASSSRHHGPTLQAISSDDESSSRQRKRRSGIRRRSAAYGTLETIMSSSRSSEEDKSKKKSAQELTAEVRGRAARHYTADSGASSSCTADSNEPQKQVARKKSASFATALMDNTRQHNQGEITSPRTSGTALVGEPAKPKTSKSHLEIRTMQEESTSDNYTHEPSREPSQPTLSDSVANAAISRPDEPRSSSSLLSGISHWIPWRGNSSTTEAASSAHKHGKAKSYAEGSLRELLKGTDIESGAAMDLKGKSARR
ncbi:hypothetical protein G7054_g9288 [Neopestalotiopsis clavispora]|nr:hypothetical protein G7054_g9288 [Neopestalotiopsis clavispora]